MDREWKVGDKITATENSFGITAGRQYEVVEIVETGDPVILDDNGDSMVCEDWASCFRPQDVHDAVEFPNHYDLSDVDETIDLIRRELTEEEFRGYVKGNILKYVTRASRKNGEEDWKKAKKYAERL